MIDIVLIAYGSLGNQAGCENSVEQTLDELNTNCLSSRRQLQKLAYSFGGINPRKAVGTRPIRMQLTHLTHYVFVLITNQTAELNRYRFGRQVSHAERRRQLHPVRCMRNRRHLGQPATPSPTKSAFFSSRVNSCQPRYHISMTTRIAGGGIAALSLAYGSCSTTVPDP